MSRTGKSPYYNASAYPNPTAFHGTKQIIKEEAEMDKTVHDMVYVIKGIAELLGFEVVGRIHFKHKKTGKDFK